MLCHYLVGLRHQSIRQPPHLLCCLLSMCVSASHLAIPRTSRKCVLWQGEGSPVGWDLSPTIPSLLSPTPPKEGCCCWRSSLNSPTYSPRSSSSPLTPPLLPFKRWLLVLSSLRRLTFNFLATTMPTFVLYHHHDAQHSHSLPSPHIQSARHLLHLTPTMPPMMMHVFLLQLLPTNTKYEKQTRPKARWTQGIAVIILLVL